MKLTIQILVDCPWNVILVNQEPEPKDTMTLWVWEAVTPGKLSEVKTLGVLLQWKQTCWHVEIPQGVWLSICFRISFQESKS